MTTKPSTQEIARAVLEGKSYVNAIELSTLAETNKILAAQIDTTRLKAFVIIFGPEAKSAVVTYPLISKTRLQIVSNERLDSDQFDIALHSPDVIGNILPSFWKSRVVEEWKTLTFALVILVVTLFSLAVFSNDAPARYAAYLSDPDSEQIVHGVIRFYEVVGQSLLTVMTLFLTVFALFTISQNADMAKDPNLYVHGLFHKFMRDDRYITLATAISLLASALGLLLTAAPDEIFRLSIRGHVLNKVNTLIPVLYSISAATFFISLTSLSYYSQRVIKAYESNLMKSLLDQREELAEAYKQQAEQPSEKTGGNGHNGAATN